MELSTGEKMKNVILNRFNLLAIILIFTSSHIFSSNEYKMTIEDIQVVDNQSVEASVYIENTGDQLVITSYQCALSINQNIDHSSLLLYYVEGSSELINEPNLFVGVADIDGTAELTFVSYIGNDNIRSKTLIGKFVLQGNIDISNINLLNIQWNFEGTISTIITGTGFENITNPENHVSIFINDEEENLTFNKVQIQNAFASAETGESYTADKIFDGIDCMYKGGEYNSSCEGRWLAQGFPQWITIDLGEETVVDNIKLDPYASEIGVSYDCEFYTGDYDNRVLISSETTQTDGQWSEHNFGKVKTRYITMIVTGSEGNDWCDFWEMEVYGNNSTTGIEVNEELADQSAIPNEYGISQNYPNPFNPSTKVEVMMKESGSARLDVYNLLGERVLAVLDTDLSAGVHEVSIDGSKLASGIYIYKLDIGNRFSQVKKMNLIK